jgi:hypothetical protein
VDCFQGKIVSDALSPSSKSFARGLSIAQIIEEMKRGIRLKHYSLSTERNYLDWAKRFFGYVHETKGDETVFTADYIKQFLSHLAIKRRVSASTQNQAFNIIHETIAAAYGATLRQAQGDIAWHD